MNDGRGLKVHVVPVTSEAFFFTGYTEVIVLIFLFDPLKRTC